MIQRPTLVSHLVLDWVQLLAIGLVLAEGLRAQDVATDALADLTTQAIRHGLGWS